ncbi:MAG TPA: OmpH family outer membrane protein [Bacteroidaceae bacterium]|jgi:outer membrane protein|nr:OmpH family outer membrane protein [Bacteroidaceae bacterium]MBP8602476.1 OmpH family outer membrane protein [Bacteroidaceae bacterium]HOD68035.1 OmpH family outer membrane protein [Bacteroidaceae bacterium]HPB03445.1 OmpH family outer membrane protein [Bacteroidaceae bacterium]HPX99169.1 OmpH family outer membrane protein [Bacteroidaceae bacterium]
MKKILAIILALAPMCMYGQKFGSINSANVAQLMPEYKSSQTELDNLQKVYDEELQYMMNEYTKKVEDYESQRETLPENIRARREQEIMESRQKMEQYYSESVENLNNKHAELMEMIQTKLLKAIKDVGEEGGYICIFDLSNAAVPFVNTALTTDVTEAVKAKLDIQ